MPGRSRFPDAGAVPETPELLLCPASRQLQRFLRLTEAANCVAFAGDKQWGGSHVVIG
jgi:hypothetical protein